MDKQKHRPSPAPVADTLIVLVGLAIIFFLHDTVWMNVVLVLCVVGIIFFGIVFYLAWSLAVLGKILRGE